MANSKENKNEVSSSDFAGDLDSMLNDAELSMDGQSDFIDDDDAIDKLLMDDEFDEFSENEKLGSNDEAQIDDILNDEFGDDAEVNDLSGDELGTDGNVDEAQVDDFVAEKVEEGESPESAQVDNASEAIDVDEFMDDEDVFGEVNDDAEALPEESMAEINEFGEAAEESDDDFLMADFDISSDDADDEFGGDEFSEPETAQEDGAELSVDSVPEVESIPEVVEKKPEATVAPSVQIDQAEIDSLNAQISQLWAENENVKQQLMEVAAENSSDDLISGDIESLQKEQRKFKKLLFESQNKVPVVTYVAIGIAVLALLVGGIFGAIGYGAQSDVESLSELVLTLEEELEILTAKDLTKDFEKINEKINKKYSDLVSKNEKLKEEMARLSKQLKTNPLTAVVDDLVEQNNHAQEAIESLLVKVGELEKRKFASVVTKRAKKVKVKPKIRWMVNLVSFKQEWYARRKVIEFKKKGIAAGVKKVKIDGDTWFRLSVKGFKSQYEAAAYAVKVKKVLNLSEVWVAKS